MIQALRHLVFEIHVSEKWRTALHVQFTFLEKSQLNSAGNLPRCALVFFVLKPQLLPRPKARLRAVRLNRFQNITTYLSSLSVVWQIGVDDNIPDDTSSH
jgi:hypothetical protein